MLSEKVRIFDKNKVSEIRVSEIRVSEIRGSKIRGSEIRVSKIRISSNHHELHGAIFCCQLRLFWFVQSLAFWFRYSSDLL